MAGEAEGVGTSAATVSRQPPLPPQGTQWSPELAAALLGPPGPREWPDPARLPPSRTPLGEGEGGAAALTAAPWLPPRRLWAAEVAHPLTRQRRATLRGARRRGRPPLPACATTPTFCDDLSGIVVFAAGKHTEGVFAGKHCPLIRRPPKETFFFVDAYLRLNHARV